MQAGEPEKEHRLDEQAVRRIVEDWSLVGWPIRPDAARVALYRSTVRAATSALVLGATLELIDMLLVEGVGRVTAIDQHPETMEAMRRLATEDWSRVERVVGDWRDPRAGWSDAFDLVLCDGGLMFLPFPDAWRTVLALVHGYLRPAGRLVAGMSSVSPTAEGFGEPYARALAGFDAERPALDPERQARRFVELMSQVRGMAYSGAVDDDGSVRADAVAVARRWMAEDLCRRYPEFERIVQSVSGRAQLLGDGALIVARPGLDRVAAELARCGFDVEVLASSQRPPRHWFTVAATRRDIQMG
jgi:hypothetical protein